MLEGKTGGVLLVDAANVIGSRPTGWWKDRAGAARVFVGQVRAAVASGRIAAPVFVVLEGEARQGVPTGVVDGVTILHAPGSGDDTLVSTVANEARRGHPRDGRSRTAEASSISWGLCGRTGVAPHTPRVVARSSRSRPSPERPGRVVGAVVSVIRIDGQGMARLVEADVSSARQGDCCDRPPARLFDG